MSAGHSGAGSMSCSVNGFAETLVTMAKDVADEDRKALKKNVHDAAKVCRREVSDLSPRRTGRYARGWRMNVQEDSDDHISAHVYNATDYQLTHLLEKGHEQFFMGHDLGYRTPGRPHIEPAYEAGKRELEGGR